MKEYSVIKKMVLRALSEDSRASITTLAKKLKCSRNTILNNMRSLEEEFGLYYTIEFDKDRIGNVQNQIWNVQFGNKPSIEELRKIFENDTAIRFAARTEGDFDLIIRALTENEEAYAYWALRTVNKLLPYRPIIRPSMSMLIHFGYMPIVNSVVEKLDLSDRGLDQLDKNIILLLNDDARLSYRDMAKKLGVPIEIVRYRFRKIIKSQIIRRFTVAITKPPTEYNIAFFIKYAPTPGLFKRYSLAYKYYLDIDEDFPIMNSIQFLSLQSGSHMAFGIGCFENEEEAIKKIMLKHKEIYKEDSPRVLFAKITDVIKGYVPIRNIDIKKEYQNIDLDRINK